MGQQLVGEAVVVEGFPQYLSVVGIHGRKPPHAQVPMAGGVGHEGAIRLEWGAVGGQQPGGVEVGREGLLAVLSRLWLRPGTLRARAPRQMSARAFLVFGGNAWMSGQMASRRVSWAGLCARPAQTALSVQTRRKAELMATYATSSGG